jgi:hypothetical protein
MALTILGMWESGQRPPYSDFDPSDDAGKDVLNLEITSQNKNMYIITLNHSGSMKY